MIGESIARAEDRRLVCGRGCYVDDVRVPGTLHAVFVRSRHARARIAGVNLQGLRGARGFVAAYTHVDLGELDRPLPLGIPHPGLHHPRTQLPLVRRHTRFVGEPIAMIVATDRGRGEDLAARVQVDYEPLPPVVGLTAAAAADALVHADVPGNLAAELVCTVGDPEAALRRAPRVTSRRLSIERGAAMPLETRGVLACPVEDGDGLVIYDSTQAPTQVRAWLAGVLGVPEHKVDVVCPDIGGGFGVKGARWYPEELLVPLAALRLRRPVKWVEERSEHFVGTNHASRQVHEAQIAYDEHGRVLALRDRFAHDTGAYVPLGVLVPLTTQNLMLGPYRVSSYHSECRVLYTNTVPVTPYRGAGQPAACFVMERMLDAVADDLELDRVEVRSRNLIRRDEFPYRPGTPDHVGQPAEYDSGDPPRLLEEALRLAGAHELDRHRTAAVKRRRRLGFGVALCMEVTGGELYEGARVRVEPSGKVLVTTGISTQGQGQHVTLAQIAAETLGVRVDDVMAVAGDTRQFRWGAGTFASRSAVIAGNAVAAAAAAVHQKAVALGAAVLEAAPDDVTIEDGRVSVRGSHRPSVSLGELAHLANPVLIAYDNPAVAAARLAPGPPKPLEPGATPGLEATSYFSPPAPSWASGCHAVIVEIDPETLAVEIVRYAAVHDCGRLLNPAIVEGQIRGGIVQGIGGTLYEKLHYDEQGQLVTGSLLDYLVPTAPEVPDIRVGHLETLSPTNPLGVKGTGEAGIIPVAAALVSAIEDALATHISETPLTRNRLFELSRDHLDVRRDTAVLR